MRREGGSSALGEVVAWCFVRVDSLAGNDIVASVQFRRRVGRARGAAVIGCGRESWGEVGCHA